jgi:hypothetical protein
VLTPETGCGDDDLMQQLFPASDGPLEYDGADQPALEALAHGQTNSSTRATSSTLTAGVAQSSEVRPPASLEGGQTQPKSKGKKKNPRNKKASK